METEAGIHSVDGASVVSKLISISAYQKGHEVVQNILSTRAVSKKPPSLLIQLSLSLGLFIALSSGFLGRKVSQGCFSAFDSNQAAISHVANTVILPTVIIMMFFLYFFKCSSYMFVTNLLWIYYVSPFRSPL